MLFCFGFCLVRWCDLCAVFGAADQVKNVGELRCVKNYDETAGDLFAFSCLLRATTIAIVLMNIFGGSPRQR